MRRIFASAAAALTLAITGAAAADYYDTHLLTAKDVQLYLRIMHKAADQADAIRAKQKPCPKLVDPPKGPPAAPGRDPRYHHRRDLFGQFHDGQHDRRCHRAAGRRRAALR